MTQPQQLLILTIALLVTGTYQQPWVLLQNTGSNTPVTRMLATQFSTCHELIVMAGKNVWYSSNNMSNWNSVSSAVVQADSISILVNGENNGAAGNDISFQFTTAQDSSLYQFNLASSTKQNLSHFIPKKGETITIPTFSLQNEILYFYNQTVDNQGHFSKNNAKSSTFRHIFINNTFQTFHVLALYNKDQNKWFEAFRPLFSFPPMLSTNTNNNFVLKVVCQVISTSSTKPNDRAVIFGSYRADKVYQTNSTQPVIQLLSIPDINNPFSTKTAVTIRNIACLNCTYIDSTLLTTQVRTKTLIFIILSSTAKSQSKNQIWLTFTENGRISTQATKLKFNHTDSLFFAVKCINFDETEGIIAASKNNLYWFNVSAYSTQLSWETPTSWENLNISSRVFAGVNITSLIFNTILIPNPNNSNKTMLKPCLLIGLSNGTVLFFYWNGLEKNNFTLTSLTPGIYLPDEAIISMIINTNEAATNTLYIGTSGGNLYRLSNNYSFLYNTFPQNRDSIVITSHNSQGRSLKGYKQSMENWSWASTIQSLQEFYFNKKSTQCSLFNSHFQDWIYQVGINCCFDSNQKASSNEYQLCYSLDEVNQSDLTPLLKKFRINAKSLLGQATTSYMLKNQFLKNNPSVLWVNDKQYLLLEGYVLSINEDYLLFNAWDSNKGAKGIKSLSELNMYEIESSTNIYSISYVLWTSD